MRIRPLVEVGIPLDFKLVQGYMVKRKIKKEKVKSLSSASLSGIHSLSLLKTIVFGFKALFEVKNWFTFIASIYVCIKKLEIQ